MSEITIASGGSTATLSSNGAYVSALSLDRIEVLKPADDGSQTHGGSAVLIPYAGRIREGRYTFEGRTFQFPPLNGGNSIHGFAKDRRWRVLGKGSGEVTLGVRLRDEGYPGLLETRVTYSVGPRTFSTHCAVANVGRRAAPFAAGFHPYFLASRWKLSTTGRVYHYELAKRLFPTGKREPFNFSKVGARTKLDDVFRVGGTIMLETEKYSLVMTRRNMPFLVVYNGQYADGRSVAVEPYSALNDSFNNGIGLRIIRPGESFGFGYMIRLSNRPSRKPT